MTDSSSGIEILLIPVVLVAILVIGAMGAMSGSHPNVVTYPASEVNAVEESHAAEQPIKLNQYDTVTDWILGLDKAGHVDKHSAEIVNYDSVVEWLRNKQCLDMKEYLGCHPPLKSERIEISCRAPDGRWVLMIISTLMGTMAGDGTIISVHQKDNEGLIMTAALNRDNCQPPISISP